MEVDRIWKGTGKGNYKERMKGDEKGWKRKGKNNNKGGKGFQGFRSNNGWNQGKGIWADGVKVSRVSLHEHSTSSSSSPQYFFDL